MRLLLNVIHILGKKKLQLHNLQGWVFWRFERVNVFLLALSPETDWTQKKLFSINSNNAASENIARTMKHNPRHISHNWSCTYHKKFTFVQGWFIYKITSFKYHRRFTTTWTNISCDLLKLVIPFLSVFRSDSKFCGMNNYYNGVAGCQFFVSLSLSVLCPRAFSFHFCSCFNAYRSLRKTDRQSKREWVSRQACTSACVFHVLM